jgi:prepilin-type N-terminal cleavage/methylation domain-containing protein/prepilin-type processing-associated H-X9-DG protein
VKTKKAFTLIELLVVISIIALLMAIMMPALERARGQAKKVVCATHMRQNLLALRMYSVDNDDESIPRVREENSSGTMVPLPWDISLRDYFSAATQDSGKKYVACPADRKPRVRPASYVYEDYLGTEALPRSYQLNGALDNGAAAWGNESLIKSTPLWFSSQTGKVSKVSSIRNASDVLWMVECFVGAKDENYRGMRDARTPVTALKEGCVQGSNYWGSTWWAPTVAGFQAVYGGGVEATTGDQHKRGANWAFMDGRVEWYNHNKSAADLYHAYGGPVYPFSWCDTKAKVDYARDQGWEK